MESLQKFKAPNARFFYIKGTRVDFDFHKMSLLLDEALAHAPRLASAHKYCDLYVNLDNQDIEFGREVIGYNPLSRDQESLYGYKLLNMGEGLETEIENVYTVDFDNIVEIFEERFKDQSIESRQFRLRFCWNDRKYGEQAIQLKLQILC